MKAGSYLASSGPDLSAQFGDRRSLSGRSRPSSAIGTERTRPRLLKFWRTCSRRPQGATVRALTAERRATVRARVASTQPLADSAATAPSPLSAARAAASAPTVSQVPLRRRVWRLGRITSTASTSAAARRRARPAPVGAGALHADAKHRAPTLRPAGQPAAALSTGDELRGAQNAAGAVDRGRDTDAVVGVDPAENLGSIRCHKGDAPLWPYQRGHHRPPQRTRHPRCPNQGPYHLTPARPVDAPPAANNQPTDPPHRTTKAGPRLGHTRPDGKAPPS